MSYEIGYIINMEIEGEYQQVAEWCNANQTVTIEAQEDESYKIVAVEVPPPLSLHEQAMQISMPKNEFIKIAIALTADMPNPVTLQSIMAFVEADENIYIDFMLANTVERNNPLLDGVTAQYGEEFVQYLDYIFVYKDYFLDKIAKNEVIDLRDLEG